MIEKLEKIVEEVQKDEGYFFDLEALMDTFFLTLAKCKHNGKDEDYVPVLFRNELHDYVMRERINRAGGVCSV